MSVTIRLLQGDLRARITADGTVTSYTGQTIGFINGDGSAGDMSESLLGEIDPTGKVTNSVGNTIGFIDESRLALLDIHQNIFMTISETGRIENGQQIVVGTSKPFRPFLFRVISSYLWFFDPALAGNGHFSLVTSEKGKGFLVEVSSERVQSACLIIIDSKGQERAQLTMMGEVKSASGELLGYVNNDGTCGDANECFLGEIKPTGEVLDKNETTIGIWSKDRQYLQLGQELFPNISPNGEIKNKAGEVVGTFQLFAPVKYVLAAAYLYFFDATLVQPSLTSLVSTVAAVANKPVHLVRQSSVQNPLMTQQHTPVPPSVSAIPQSTLVQVQGQGRANTPVPLSSETERLKQQAVASRKQSEELAKLQEKLLQEKSKTEADRLEAERARLKLEAERSRVKLEAEKAKAVLELKAAKEKAESAQQQQQTDRMKAEALVKAEKEKREAERLAELEAAMRETMEAAAQVELQKIRDSEVLKREEEELRQLEEIKSKQKVESEKAELLVVGTAEEILGQIQKQLEEERVLAQASRDTDTSEDHQHEEPKASSSSSLAQVQREAKASSASSPWKPPAKPANNYAPEELAPGINPDEIVEVAVALYDYTHPDASAREFFCFHAGDKFYLLHSGPELQGWKIARNVKGEKGFVPGNYLQILPSSARPKPANADKQPVKQQEASSNDSLRTLQQAKGATTSKDNITNKNTSQANKGTPMLLASSSGKLSKKDKSKDKIKGDKKLKKGKK